MGEYTIHPAEMKQAYQKTIKGEKGALKEYEKGLKKYDKGALKEYLNTINSGYQFNDHPTLP